MSNTVRLTWAVPVSAHLLGARLEAYGESKAAISTVRLCAQYANLSGTPLARLPTEVLNQIVGFVSDSIFEERLPDWVDMFKCHDDGGDSSDDGFDYLWDVTCNDEPYFHKAKKLCKRREVQGLDPGKCDQDADDSVRYSHEISILRFILTFSASINGTVLL